MICSTDGFLTIHHNEVRDLTAQLLTEVCPSVSVKLPLHAAFELGDLYSLICKCGGLC